GPGMKHEGTGTLAILQTREVHDELEQLFSALRKARDLQFPLAVIPTRSDEPQAKPAVAGSPAPMAPILLESSPATAALEAALKKQADFDFQDRPLQGVLDARARTFSDNVWVDGKGLADA